MKRTLPALALTLLTALPLRAAEPPRVVTDILPVHSLVARVMEGAGAPELLLPPGADAHGYAMRPSEAQMLEGADLVVWIGPGLTPWLERGLSALAQDASRLTLMEAPGVTHLEIREGARFAPHDHGAEHEDHEEGHDDAHVEEHDEVHEGAHADGHDEVHEEAHEDAHEDGHKDEDEAHAEAAGMGHDGHAHAGEDPHVWLDPRNAAAMVRAISGQLSAQDPERAGLYAANAAAALAELEALEAELGERLVPFRGTGFVVLHDAFHYFEARFGVEAAGAVSASDAASPGAARIGEIGELLRGDGIRCIFAEPQQSGALVEQLARESGARLGLLDPLGAGIEPGAALYPALMRGMAAAMADCLAEGA